ncbi:hypothetical protein O9K51_09724 [Purpureocillium lavendulum]|uniref:Uncharacterized protein n=1 Tax=Purpureocillium lavendulum TaxID=1247861 RepID=A0AB34FGD6_9HYPO|nr:hypothetical protein O9K51_09724 [Purpureocillium lavendulum]
MARQPFLWKTASKKKRQLQRGATLSSDRPGNGKTKESTMVSKERRPLKGSRQVGAVWFQYHLADGETFDYIMDDVLPRFRPEENGNALYAVAHMADGQHMVDVLLVTNKPVRVTSVTHPDAWGRKGARGLATIVREPGPKQLRSVFVKDCVSKLSDMPFLREAGSIQDVLDSLDDALDAEKERIAGTSGKRSKPRGAVWRPHHALRLSTSVDEEPSADIAPASDRSPYWSVVMEGGKSRH